MDIQVDIKVFLKGTFDAGTTMRTNLNDNGLLPNVVDGYTMSTAAQSNTGAAKIVDWVSLELRDATDNTIVIASRPALLQADGTIVDMDGSSPVSFSGLNLSAAYVAVRHRNHLGVMTATPISF